MMKTTIERIDDSKLRLDIEVPQQTLDQAVESTLQYMGTQLNLPGFRPGKVPPKAVLARLGRSAVIDETIRVHLEDWYRAAVIASGVRPVAQPEFDMGDDESLKTTDSGLRFSATVEVVKKPKLPELSALEVDRPNIPDIQKYVDQVLEATLRGAGELEDAGRGAKEGDEVVVDFRCTIDGEEIGGASATGYQARLGDGRLLGELESAIEDQEAGAELDVPVTFPSDHPMPQLAGKDAVFHLTLRSVQIVKLPELTDEVAAKVSEFSTAAELDADIRGSITKRLDDEVQGIFRGNAVSALAKATDLEEPEALVQGRQQEMYQNLKQQLDQAGLSMEAYLDRAGRDMTELFSELEESARDDLRRELALLALAEESGISVSEDDLRAEITEHANHTGQAVEEAFMQVMRSGRADMLRGELLIQRTIDHLVKSVKPRPVDLPTEEEAAAEAAANGEVPVGTQTESKPV